MSRHADDGMECRRTASRTDLDVAVDCESADCWVMVTSAESSVASVVSVDVDALEALRRRLLFGEWWGKRQIGILRQVTRLFADVRFVPL